MKSPIASPFASPAHQRGTVSRQSRDAGAYRGSLASWNAPRIIHKNSEARERTVMSRRAEDLYANDWAARSGIEDICMNSIGTGLVPQVKIPAALLGISPQEAAKLQEQMEWIFSAWSENAHAKGLVSFEGLQFAAMRSILRNGECFHMPVSLPLETGRVLSLAIQDIAPARVATPADMQTCDSVRDGIRLSECGAPVAYFIANPTNTLTVLDYHTLCSDQFIERPAHLGHRKNVFHLYRYEDEEQVRGYSLLAPAMQLFRNLSDCMNYELMAQVMAACFPIFIETEGASVMDTAAQMGFVQRDENHDTGLMVNLGESGITFGKAGQKPHVLESKRPSANFASFMEIIQRAMAASMGSTYEAVTRDFSKSNYSSTRAAMNEVWKMYLWYRKWFAASYCQPIFNMVMEEAVLRGALELPTSLDDFYAKQRLWCNATWVGPARGFVDPVKEIQAAVMRLQNGLDTYENVIAEFGGDFDENLPTMREERERLASLPPLNISAQRTLKAPNNEALVDQEPVSSENAEETENNSKNKEESDHAQ